MFFLFLGWNQLQQAIDGGLHAFQHLVGHAAFQRRECLDELSSQAQCFAALLLLLKLDVRREQALAELPIDLSMRQVLVENRASDFCQQVLCDAATLRCIFCSAQKFDVLQAGIFWVTPSRSNTSGAVLRKKAYVPTSLFTVEVFR